MGLRAGLSFPVGFSDHHTCLSLLPSVCAELCAVLLVAWGCTAVGAYAYGILWLSSPVLFIQCRGLLLAGTDLGWWLKQTGISRSPDFSSCPSS